MFIKHGDKGIQVSMLVGFGIFFEFILELLVSISINLIIDEESWITSVLKRKNVKENSTVISSRKSVSRSLSSFPNAFSEKSYNQ